LRKKERRKYYRWPSLSYPQCPLQWITY